MKYTQRCAHTRAVPPKPGIEGQWDSGRGSVWVGGESGRPDLVAVLAARRNRISVFIVVTSL